MAFPKSLELRDWLMANNMPSSDTVDEILADPRNYREDTWLDYKQPYRDARRFKDDLRKYVAGFGNSDGGVLVLGVKEEHEEPTAVVGCPSPDARVALDSWVRDVVLDLLPRFSPQPRISPPVRHRDGDVLFVAVPRAPELIAVNHEGRLKYAFRNVDSTFWADDWMISDLLVGRRRHAVLRPTVSWVDVKAIGATIEGAQCGLACFSPRYSVENLGLVTADDVIVGLIGFSSLEEEPRLSQHLLSHLDVVRPSFVPRNFRSWPWVLKHISTRRAQE